MSMRRGTVVSIKSIMVKKAALGGRLETQGRKRSETAPGSSSFIQLQRFRDSKEDDGAEHRHF